MKLNNTKRMLLGIIQTGGDEYTRFCKHAMSDFLEVSYATVHNNLSTLIREGLVEKISKRCWYSGQDDVRFRITEAGVTALDGMVLRLHEKARRNMILRPTYAFGPPKDWNPLDYAEVIIPVWGSPGYDTLSVEEYMKRIKELHLMRGQHAAESTR